MSDEKPGREDDAAASGPDAELTDEQLDREAPGVDDAEQLEAAEDQVAADAEADEEKVIIAPSRRRRGGRITAEDEDDDEVEVEDEPGRAARSARVPAKAGAATPSRAAAERARADELRRKRSLGRFLREVVAELRKVIWPGRRELITYTAVVIVFVTFVVALVAGFDLLFAQGVIVVFG